MKTLKRIQIIAATIFILLTSCNVKPTSTQQNDSSDESEITVENRTTEEIAEKARMQVVFLLDATGSMSGLIGTAKEKIWSIVGSFSQAEPTPEIEVGMIFYRDRGDDFITKIIPLGTNMDDLYEQLTLIEAHGGGDEPESVNQALHEGITKMSWNLNDKKVYKSIFLVGDCPPHMDYRDDVKYPESCDSANEKNIIINTILMGNNSEAKKIWKEIATKTNGEFIQTDMNVNNITVSTPYDKKISDLQYELDKTRIYYGSEKEMGIADVKHTQSEKMKSTDVAIGARRAEYNISKAGKKEYYGHKELLNDVSNGKSVTEIAKSELPEYLREMSAEKLDKYVNEKISARKNLEKEIVELGKQRQEYIDNELEKMDKKKVENSFDEVIFNAVKSQAAEKADIKIEGKAKR